MMNVQEYLLVCLMEEASEVQKAVSKCLRFGFDDIGPSEDQSNIENLIDELNDFNGVLVALMAAEVHKSLNDDIISSKKIEAKVKKIGQYLKYSKELGLVNE